MASANLPLPSPPLLKRSVTGYGLNNESMFAALDSDEDEAKVYPTNPIHLPFLVNSSATSTSWGDDDAAVSPLGRSAETALTSLNDSSWETVESRNTRRKRRKREKIAEMKRLEEEAQADACSDQHDDCDMACDEPVEYGPHPLPADDPRSPTIYRHAYAYVEEFPEVSD